MTLPKLQRDNPIASGNRVKSARMLSGYCRKAFAELSTISAATLRAWEEPGPGRKGLTEKGAKRLVHALQQAGVYCTIDWLLFGIGTGPRLINKHKHTLFPNTEDVTWGEDEAILRDIDAFKQNNHEPVVAIVTDGAMLPLFSYGDYVAGSKVSGKALPSLVGLNCIIETEQKTMIRRLTAVNNDLYTLTALNQDAMNAEPVLTNVNILWAAEIVWHRWKKRIGDIKI